MLSEAAEKLAIKDQGMGLGTGVPRLEDRDIILKSALVALIQTKQRVKMETGTLLGGYQLNSASQELQLNPGPCFSLQCLRRSNRKTLTLTAQEGSKSGS
jgi:hypothetical protein